MRKLVWAAICGVVFAAGLWVGYGIGHETGYYIGAYDTWNTAYREGAADGLMACDNIQQLEKRKINGYR